MFDTLFLQLGEKVVIKACTSTDSTGLKALIGKTGVIHGFGHRAFGPTRNFGIRPGIYCDRSAPIIVIDGSEAKDQHLIPARIVQIRAPEREAIRQSARFLVPDASWRTQMERDFLRPLPPTPFWEGDIVRLNVGPNKRHALMSVVSVDYDAIEAGAEDTQAVYGVASSVGEGVTHVVSAVELRLFSRGNVWRKSHNEQIVTYCEDDHAEVACALAVEMGHYDIILPQSTPTSRRWTKKSTIEALRDGSIDYLLVNQNTSDLGPAANSNSRALFGIKFFDQDLGIRLAHRALRALTG